MRTLLVAALVVWAAGLLLIVASIAEGGARVALVVIVPVVSGSSLTFLLGVALLIAGFLLGFLGVPGSWVEPPASEAPSEPVGSERSGVGGVVLVGPVPIVFGSWRGTLSRRTRWTLALAGAALVIVACALAYARLAR